MKLIATLLPMLTFVGGILGFMLGFGGFADNADNVESRAIYFGLCVVAGAICFVATAISIHGKIDK